MNLYELCRAIELPNEVCEKLFEIRKGLSENYLLKNITVQETAKEAYQKLKAICINDTDGFIMLTYMLTAALNTYSRYLQVGISDKIFFEIMKCFTRFVNEHKASFGRYGFDRAWWTYRQLSMTLFKVGELEFEYRDDEKTIHIHIPTDSNINLELCNVSHNGFKDFTQKFYAEKMGYDYTLNSWLLSPALDKLLDSDSKIIKLKNCFEIVSQNKEDMEFLQWIYGRTDIEYKNLPERTTLQRNMKKYLLQGGIVGSAKGALKEFTT